MVLRVFCCIVFLVFRYALFAGNAMLEQRDFHYAAHVDIKMEKNLFEQLSDIISESEIADEIKKLRTFSQQDKTVSNMRALRDRVINDVDAIYQKAYYYGFYDAKVNYKIKKLDVVHVDISVDLGRIFNLELNFTFDNQDDDFKTFYDPIFFQKLRMSKASMKDMKKLLEAMLFELQKRGFVEPTIKEKKATVQYDKHSVLLNVVIDTGEKGYFSDTTIKAFPGINTEFIKNRIDWHEGEMFDIEKVQSTEESLKDTQIFSRVKVKSGEMADERVPMSINLEEEKKHTIGVSLLYSGMRNMNFEKKSQTQKSLKSIIARLSWERNNAFGNGEKLNVIIEGTPMKIRSKRADYGFETKLMQPDICMRNDTMTYVISRRQELTNAFFKKSDKGGFLYNYPFNKIFSVGIGFMTERNVLDSSDVLFCNSEDNRKYEDASIPLEFVFDKTDSLLNPTEGYRLTAKYTKTFFRHAGIRNLSNAELGFAYNYSLDEIKRTVLAFNVKGVQILKHNVDDIPIDKRLYAGGMNSVRGYANQMACEIIEGEGAPFGGKKLLEFNTEVRRKFNSNFGGVLFFDGARIFENQSRYENIKIEKKRWFCSVGFGVRYFTSIGPIRVDFAFPIKRRRGVDSRMQFIMSLGQAF
ncbi:MAG: BamA/TamA family outer membrane protein [Alphaproteobacteria bacterium]|nr:BamA/TamA family outer membrane protein [Alphaproteobacteria bacterium]